MRFKDRVALITGSGSGIGAATAKRFAQEGATVVIADMNEENLAKVAAEIQAMGGSVLTAVTNVVNKGDVEAMVSKAVNEFGHIDILINNAGVTKDAVVKKMTEEQWDFVIYVNLKGTFLCSQAVFGPMSEQKYGKIVNTSSVGSLGNVGQANYAAAKSGIIGLTKTLALEYARYNINVNCIAPGATKTAMTAAVPQQVLEAILGTIPFRRMAEPEEIANMHLFLSSDEAGYVTGQVIFVDGGMTTGV